MSRFGTIVADPPWEMARGSDYSWREGKASGERQALDYGTMTTAEIAALPVKALAAPDSHLFVWTTHRHLEATFEIVRAWGFTYVCTLVWCKQPHGWGPGGAFQSTTEFVLYARRGKSGVEGQIDRQWWTWPRGEHSAKPEAFLDMVEAKFPGPHLENVRPPRAVRVGLLRQPIARHRRATGGGVMQRGVSPEAAWQVVLSHRAVLEAEVERLRALVIALGGTP